MDHLIPDCEGGSFTLTNLTVSCAFCNGARRDKPFFDFIEHFTFSDKKIRKYQQLLNNYSQIKILRLAIELCGENSFHIPQKLLNQAAQNLKIEPINFTQYLPQLSLSSLQDFQKRKEIIAAFETIIALIEKEKQNED